MVQFTKKTVFIYSWNYKSCFFHNIDLLHTVNNKRNELHCPKTRPGRKWRLARQHMQSVVAAVVHFDYTYSPNQFSFVNIWWTQVWLTQHKKMVTLPQHLNATTISQSSSSRVRRSPSHSDVRVFLKTASTTTRTSRSFAYTCRAVYISRCVGAKCWKLNKDQNGQKT